MCLGMWFRVGGLKLVAWRGQFDGMTGRDYNIHVQYNNVSHSWYNTFFNCKMNAILCQICKSLSNKHH